MATPQLSPGVLIREVDLTVGRAENVLDNIGAIAGPFVRGSVDEAVQVNTSQQLIDTYGKPQSANGQYEYWMTASSFLSYGGVLKIVRADDDNLNNGNAGVGYAASTVTKIKNKDDYESNFTSATGFTYAAKNPGSWSNSMKVCFIDNAADQRLGITTDSPSTAGMIIGYGVTASLTDVAIPGAGSTSSFSGYLKGIITGVSTDATGKASTIDVKVTARVETVGGGSTETSIEYAESDPAKSFEAADTLSFVNNSGINTGGGGASGRTEPISTVKDWYDEQTLGLTNSTVYWKAVAPKPKTSNYATDRSGKNDALHIVIVDDTGDITGIQGNIIEKHTFLSKAKDTIADGESGKKVYYKDYLVNNSEQIYAGYNPSNAADTYWNTEPLADGFTSGTYTKISSGDGLWGQNAQGVNFSSLGNVSYTFTGGKDYNSGTGDYTATLGNLLTAYNKFENKDDQAVDFLVMGPGLGAEDQTQAKANLLISLANSRKDCVACISPHRQNLVGVTNNTTQTNNLLKFFSPLSSSSYAVFDSGYKYMYDRFNNEFRWIPCNGDTAGLMVRTGINAYPWFSPAGQQRGILNNAVKLAYSPNKDQRDLLYSSRINPVINQKGIGILLYGDKTGLGYASAFDRINVRRLFLTVEQSLEGAANAQLFELNDVNTRSNFVNIVEPYLRDVQAKRGLYDFLVVCDETNNTPDVIDNNEFRADIYLKPTKSINFVTLTFVATRTGVAFEEVVGTV